jgi:3-hydroxyisobutyrate dehydrogenase
MIAFLGMGLLGSNFVRALRRRGEEVHVWNRTHVKAHALAADGAVAFEHVTDAVAGATRVHLTLSDDEAVDEVLSRCAGALATGTTIVDHTTTSPAGTAVRAAHWSERGVAFQHAPVFMGPKNALEGTGFMLASGERARFDALSDELARMTGTLVYVGPQPERAAAMKLIGNLFIMAISVGLIDSIALARDLGVSAAEVMDLLQWFNPGASAPARLRRVLTADIDDPSWTLAMARKDARLMMDAAQRGEVPLILTPAVADAMDRWIRAGAAGKDWTVLAHDALAGM